MDLAAVLAVRGEDAGAERAAALELFELKGNVAGAERARREWRR